MSLQRPPSYAPRITILSLLLTGLLGVGFNVDAVFGPIPEPSEEAPVPDPRTISSGTDFDMETQVAEIILKKATDKLLAEASAGLPPLAEDWSPESLPRDLPSGAYVEDEDEAEYYDDLDRLKTVMKASSDKERAALAKLFETDKRTAAAEVTAASAPKKRVSTPLALRPNAAVITRKKPKAGGASPRSRASASPQKAERAGRSPSAQAAAAAKPTEPTVGAAEPTTGGPAVDPNATTKELIAQGRKLLLSGNPTTAEKAYRLALTKNSGSARARYGLAKALYQRNRASEATAELRKILSGNKNHGSALLMMGSLLQEQGQAAQARSYYQRYLDARPNGRRANEVRSILARL
jgi:tetratricopeptide (TPR) repeat protein